MSDFYPLLWSTGIGMAVLIAYMALVRRAADVVHPVRMQMARLGREILAAPNVSAAEKANVRFFLDNAFNASLPFISAVAMLVLGPVYIIRRVISKKKSDPELNGTDPRVKKLVLMFLLSSIAANPLFGALMLIEITITAVVTTLLTRQLKAWQGVVKALVVLEVRSSNIHVHS
ncbi:hypothetical protein [Burkholderia stagnalis]|uniref:hypothetical protein n=1 Tax=Burkholderia stagnalis TaxID=1503054 RepID=UPI000759ABA8|nr:hypothetical protein [Burkholderia stagnalis]KVM89898.1 hypothetical protein WT07_04300 [Burkholderia stagnalis]KWE12445.1 hypothetical protein WT47_04470 [Burkholderia stagnalis]KWE13176.1 hypothetical protein WT48_21445 [Burkholderia stagnalis]KWO78178.1 hypothetical protein WU00_08970 [Burkholderia stagnalis]